MTAPRRQAAEFNALPITSRGGRGQVGELHCELESAIPLRLILQPCRRWPMRKTQIDTVAVYRVIVGIYCRGSSG